MRKITYNLAAAPQVNGRAFALRAVLLVLASLLLGFIAVAHQAGRSGKGRPATVGAGAIAAQMDEMQRQGRRRAAELASWKKAMKRALATVNYLIARKGFSLVSRLDFLEKNFSPGIRIRQLSLANEDDGRMRMTITARSLQELFALYKRLAPYELAISSESQVGDEYQVNMSLKVPNEKI